MKTIDILLVCVGLCGFDQQWNLGVVASYVSRQPTQLHRRNIDHRGSLSFSLQPRQQQHQQSGIVVTDPLKMSRFVCPLNAPQQVENLQFFQHHRNNRWGFRSSHRVAVSLFASSQSSSSTNKELEFVEAENFEALQVLFSTYCDQDGLMTKNAVMNVPIIADLLVRPQ
jgi:hypothetical protein